MKEFTIALGDLIIEAENETEAEIKAKQMIKDGWVEIHLIEEN